MSRLLRFFLLSAVLLIPGLAGAKSTRFDLAPSKISTSHEKFLLNQYGKNRILFEENKGQAPAEVKFISRGFHHTLYLTGTEAVMVLPTNKPWKIPQRTSEEDFERETEYAQARMKFVGANPNPIMVAEELSPGNINYFRGNNSSEWISGVSTYSRVRYKEIYPGIDLVFYGSSSSQLEYDFIVAPSADASVIQIEFEGIDDLSVDSGNLILKGNHLTLTQQKPKIFQNINGTEKRIEGNFAFKDDGRVAFVLGDYDRKLPLIIDPQIIFATYLGGSDDEIPMSIDLDDAGNIYICGRTLSLNFPTTAGSFDTTFNGQAFDFFVSKLNPDGSSLLYSTFLGGSLNEQVARLAVDGAGHAYIAGSTNSSDFPTTPGAFDTTFNGLVDITVTKLGINGDNLEYSTYLGSPATELSPFILVNNMGNSYVGATTSSNSYPTTPGAYSTSHNGANDIALTKLSTDGSSLEFSTFLGGSGGESLGDFILDPSGNIILTGSFEDTRFTQFPTTPNAFDNTFNGGTRDIFVSILNPDASDLLFSTYLGSSGFDGSSGIGLDSLGNIFVAGSAPNSDFPTTPGAYNTTHTGSSTGFVTKFNSTLSGLVYSTLIAESAFVSSLHIKSNGVSLVSGWTFNRNFPTTPDALFPTFLGNSDAFISRFSPDGSTLEHSTLLGGSLTDIGVNMVVDQNEMIHISGRTNSSDIPVNNGAFDTSPNGGFDAFVIKIDLNSNAPSDTTPPSITPPANLVVEATGPQTAVNLGTPIVTDDISDPADIVVTHNAPATFGLGTTIVVWTAEDEAGNLASANQEVTVRDRTPPALLVPADKTVDATGLLTPVDIGQATALDLVDGSLSPAPSTLGPFPVGETLVTWTVTDSSGNTATAIQRITLQDNDPPVVTAPADITVDATGVLTPVSLGTATAVDQIEGALLATVDNPGPFAVGVHNLIWSATDSSGNTGTDSQQVTVLGPVQILDDLRQSILDLGLPAGTENSLIAKLNTAEKLLNDNNPGNDQAGINSLNALIQSIQAQSGKKISVTEANDLIARIQNLIQLLSN